MICSSVASFGAGDLAATSWTVVVPGVTGRAAMGFSGSVCGVGVATLVLGMVTMVSGDGTGGSLGVMVASWTMEASRDIRLTARDAAGKNPVGSRSGW